MPPVVASDVVQISLIGRWTNGEPVVNVLHYRMDAEAGSVDIEDEVEDVVQNWQSQVMPEIRNNYTFVEARWIDLRSLNGETGTVPPQPGLPTTGGSTGESSNPANSILVHKNITSTRGTRSGRMYLPPPAEGAMDEDGRITGETITAYNAALASFLANTTQGGVGEAVNRQLVVLHSDGSNSPVTSLTTDALVATQRRRQR